MTNAHTLPPVDTTRLHSMDPHTGDLLGELPHVVDERARQALKARLFPGSTQLAPHIGRFTLLRELGRGGMGIVYAAYDETLDRRVALKLLYELNTGDRHAQTRLLREAQAMARLNHPNIATVYEAGTHEGRIYLAMEFVQGRPLDVWLHEKPRSWQEVVDVFVQAAHGLQAAHAAGLVHRDFKPANAMLGDDGRVRVLDFGLACGAPSKNLHEALSLNTLRDREPSDGTDRMAVATTLATASITLAGTIVGTPAYMSPEQFCGEDVDARADQFALCVSLYEALHGRLPYGHTLKELSERLVAGRRAPIDQTLPEWLIGALERGLAVDPSRRFESLENFAGALAWGRSSGGVIRSRPRRNDPQNMLWMARSVMFLNVLLAVALLSLHLNVWVLLLVLSTLAYMVSLAYSVYFLGFYRGSIAGFGKPRRTHFVVVSASPKVVFELVTQNSGCLDYYVDDMEWGTRSLCLRTRPTMLSWGALVLINSRQGVDSTEVRIDIRPVSRFLESIWWTENRHALSRIIELLGGEQRHQVLPPSGA
jgi:serine/threonine protein kinase